MRHLNAADNYYETNGADMNRMQAWHNQNDRFRPVAKNYCAIFGEAPAAFQYNVISAVSMSAYTQVGPGFKGLANPENRAFLAKWRAWASEHHAFLKVKRDLFDCPGDSAVDGSAHMIGDRGFVFLFPGGFDRNGPQAGSVRAAIPLHRWIGLDENHSAGYAVRELYPRAGADLGVHRYGEDVLCDVPRDSAVVLAVEPAAPGSMPRRPTLPESQDPAVRAFPAVSPVRESE